MVCVNLSPMLDDGEDLRSRHVSQGEVMLG